MSNGGANEDATVWAAEHGASSRTLDLDKDAADESPANVGHRFRIHGRLDGPQADQGTEHLGYDEGMKLDAEFLRRLVARESEIDARDVQFGVERERIILRGTVGDEGERQELEQLLARLPGVKAVQNELRVQTA